MINFFKKPKPIPQNSLIFDKNHYVGVDNAYVKNILVEGLAGSGKTQVFARKTILNRDKPFVYVGTHTKELFDDISEGLKQKGFNVSCVEFMDDCWQPCVPYNFLTFLDVFYPCVASGEDGYYDKDNTPINIVVEKISDYFLDKYVVNDNNYYKNFIKHTLNKSLQGIMRKTSIYEDYSSLCDDFPEDLSVGKYTEPELKQLKEFKDDVLLPLNELYKQELIGSSRKNLKDMLDGKFAIFVQTSFKMKATKKWLLSMCIFEIFLEHLLYFLNEINYKDLLYILDDYQDYKFFSKEILISPNGNQFAFVMQTKSVLEDVAMPLSFDVEAKYENCKLIKFWEDD